MKKLILLTLLSVVWLSAAHAQYRTERSGYEGDYFSLEGALDLFKQSSSLRDFERKLNTEKYSVNNLDLNYDGRIDYIRVEHRRQGDFHAIILQALVDRRDIQDVAVIEIEILRRGEAVLQIIGDEDLYGEEVIVEPVEGYSDSRSGYNSDYDNYVNVYYWEPVQYMLGRQYRVYASPYYWQYYPTWWSPWRQYSWNVYRPRIVVYVNHYHVVPRLRVVRVHNFYRPYRTYCAPVVQRANQVRVSQGRSPINRPEPAVREVVQQPRASARPDEARQNQPLSRNRTATSAEPGETRSRNSTGNPERVRTTERTTAPRETPSISRENTPDIDQKRSRTTTPEVRQPSRNSTPSRSSDTGISTESREKITTRPTVERTAPQRTEQPSRNQTTRSNPSSRSSDSGSYSTGSRERVATPTNSSRSTPARVDQPSRSQTTRSSGASTPNRTSTRSASPSVSKPRTEPASNAKAGRSTDTKQSSSRSRRGGGDF